MAAGEAPIKQAIRWINDKLQDSPSADIVNLIDEASRLFNLTPLDADFLYRNMREKIKKTPKK